MPTYTFFIYSADILVFNSGTGAFDFDASYDSTQDRYRIEVTDDDADMDSGGDANQLATVYDMDGNVVDSGVIISPTFAELNSGSNFLDRIEVNGTHYGYTPQDELTPGTSYPVTDSGPGGLAHTYFEGNSVPCFGPDTQIETTKGPRAITSLKMGDQVMTYDNGPQPIVWIGSRRTSLLAALTHENVRPVVYSAGIRGVGTPIRPLTLSQQHRVMITDPLVQLLAHTTQVFVRSAHLNTHTLPAKPVDWHHFALPNHEVICANGIWVESLFAGDALMELFSADDCAHIKQATRLQPHLKTARPCLRDFEAAVLLNRLRRTAEYAQTRNKRVA